MGHEAKIKDDYPKSRIMYKDIPLMSNVETEKWISDNGYVIWKCEVSIMGTYLVTVRSRVMEV